MTSKLKEMVESVVPSTTCVLGVIVVINISILSVNLFLLSNMRKKDLSDCVNGCLPCAGYQQRTDSCCECESDALSNYLAEEFKLSVRKSSQKTQGTQDLNQPRALRLMSHDENRYKPKPVALMKGSRNKIQPKVEKRNEMTSLVSWSKRNFCYMTRGIELRNGRLVVPAPGYYHIYGKLKIFDDVTANNTNATDSETKIVVTKYNILSGEEDLFSAAVPRTMPQNHKTTKKDVYLGSTVPLKAGDEIYLRVNNIERLKNPYQNSIGLYMI